MTGGHKHRHLRVRKYGLVHGLLTAPTLWTSRNIEWVDRSRLVFGPVDGQPGLWRLSPLGLLHGLTGFTLVVETKEERDERRAHGRRPGRPAA